jgi:hypothetical protein
MPAKPIKSKEELGKEQEEAKEQLERILSSSRPKNARQGFVNGVNNVLAGAIGGVGVAVLAPTVGLASGLKQGGLLGGIVGLTGGAVLGVVGAAAMTIAGAVSGVSQMVRGVLAAPTAVLAPSQGKWWNESTHKWVKTDLIQDEVPDNDDDILKHLQDELDLDASGEDASGEVKLNTSGGTVKDTYYYDVLEVDPQADASAIKRRYYILARKYHPDRVAPEDKETATIKFKEIAEAYQVLSDPELRHTYNQDGKDALSGDKMSTNDQAAPDAQMLFAFLFGSDRFQPYIGRLATATSAMIGDSPKLGIKDARELQHRRCTRLAKTLADKLASWVLAEEVDLCITMWQTEAADLSTASFGLEMVRTIGMVSTEYHTKQVAGSSCLFSWLVLVPSVYCHDETHSSSTL